MRLPAPDRRRAVPGLLLSSGLAACLATAGLAGTTAVTPAAAATTTVAAPARIPEVVSWGANFYGQLGNGNTTDNDEPEQVQLPAGTYTQVRGGNSSFAVRRGGKLYAWGRNDAGQLGDGTTTNRKTPVLVKLPAGVKAAAVRAGGDFTLALSTAGKVYAWGDNALGQLGNGSTTSRKKPVLVRLPRGVRVTSISAGSLSALALTRSGRVLAWGGNGNGQLGTGSTKNRHTPRYIRLSRHTKISAVAAGSLSSYAVTSKHTALAWGFNGNGRLGDGTAQQRKSPVRVHLPAGVKVTAIAGGGEHALALTTGHKVLAWGSNAHGQLGINSTTAHHTPVRVHLAAGTKITAVVAGYDWSMALATTHHILAWGYNGNGQLGNGSDNSSLVPVEVKTADLRATAIGAGPNAETALAIGGRLPV